MLFHARRDLSELRSIPLPRTRLNKGGRKVGDPRGGPRHIMESDFA
jgi:hypothetical protein